MIHDESGQSAAGENITKNAEICVMFIQDSIRELLLDPILDETLSLPVDDFVLNTADGSIALGASLRMAPDGDGLQLDLRDSAGRDLRSFFASGFRIQEKDSLNASGVLGNKLRVDFCKIWPPHISTTRPIGEVHASSAVVQLERLIIPPTGSDSQTRDQIRENLDRINPQRPPARLEEREADNIPRFEHIAVFRNTRLQFFNRGVEWTESHPFWGERRGSRDRTWDGEALGGKFSLKQAGKHLEVGFRHEGGSDDEARQRFDALLHAVAYTHAIFPWPTFVQRRLDWRVMEQSLRVVSQTQGRMVPLREKDGFTDPNAPTNLISSVAGLFHGIEENKNGDLLQAMWVFRGADSRLAPQPLQMAMICSVIEGLRSGLVERKVPPVAFTDLRTEALQWISGLESVTTCADRLGMIKRLNRVVENWNYYDRRVEWDDAFLSLFPGRDDWVRELFKLFNKHRHGPAHGDFSAGAKIDPHASLDALGRLAGLINLIVAAKAGYTGSILESPLSDRRIDLQ
ncbi:MAG: hypothetical protein MUF31_01625 [Akkermansiaceae bacterium]|nr:hypothetical protein [Akkermansiaceae bacterium]